MPSRRTILEGAGTVGLLAVTGCVEMPTSGVDAPGQTTVPTNATTRTTETTTAEATETTTTETGGTTTETTDTATNGTTAQTTGTPTQAGETVEVAVGPERRLRFVPERVELSVGDRIVWTFESPGHNVTSLPGASEKCRNPPGAEPFASYEGQRHFSINEVGTTFEHTFTVAGDYVYVCEPHADQGMVGYVTVTE